MTRLTRLKQNKQQWQPDSTKRQTSDAKTNAENSRATHDSTLNKTKLKIQQKPNKARTSIQLRKRSIITGIQRKKTQITKAKLDLA